MKKEFEEKFASISKAGDKIKESLLVAFEACLESGSLEDLQKILKATETFKKAQEALQKGRDALKPHPKLGSLTIGEEGQKDFGPFRLVWKVQMDHIQWALNEIEYPQESWLSGALKYKGWNRIAMSSELSLEKQLENKQKFTGTSLNAAPPEFEVYVHEWPSFKDAMDFLYYDLGRKSAEGSGYENSFSEPGTHPGIGIINPRGMKK